MSRGLIYPKSLRAGDTVGLVTPSSMIDNATLDKVIQFVHSLGLKCKVGETLARSSGLFTAQQNHTIDQLLPALSDSERVEYDTRVASGYMAGSPAGRAADINRFFADPGVQAIWCLRGGYSSSQVLPLLDYELIRRHPKQILGHSDVTNVIIAINQLAGLVTYHAPMVTPNFVKEEFLVNGYPDDYTLHYFNQFIMSDWDRVIIGDPTGNQRWTLVNGSCEGKIVGGNLYELAAMQGTPYAAQTDSKIVFLEEVRSHVVMCDMALTQLRNGGFFDNIRGLIIGDFLDCRNRTGNDQCGDWLIPQLLKNHFANAPYPVLGDVKLGHDRQTATIPLGAGCKLDATAKTIEIFH